MQAFRLQQQLSEAIERRDEWREKDKETPQEERERLLQQVKADNQEIGSIEKMLVYMYHLRPSIANGNINVSMLDGSVN